MALLTKTTFQNAGLWQAGRSLTSRLRVGTAARFLRQGVADLLFPPICVGCDAELDAESASNRNLPFCDECLDAMELLSGSTCGKCGAPVPKHTADQNSSQPIGKKTGCFHCSGHKLWFDETVSLGLYDGNLREIILRMKQAQGDSLSIATGRLLLDRRGSQLAGIGADVVVPIPSHWRRRMAHQTNSAALLAEVVADGLRVPLAERLLRRSRHTVPQFDLSPPERWKNVRGAFVVRAGHHLRNAKVLLVDDVLTTGATCSEAARALRKAGAERITVAVAARAMG